MRRLLALALSGLIAIPSAFGWGQEGHAIIAAVAESRLSDVTRTAARALIGNASLASIASWADDIRKQRDNTYNWHFVDIPKSADTFVDTRDCFLPTNKHAGAATDHQNCAVDRIPMFEKVLANGSGNKEEALKFLVHFVGDVHQPFHAIGDASGGNGIHISLFGTTNCPFQGHNEPCNLHAAWDDELIKHTARTQSQYVAFVKSVITQQHLDAGDPGKPTDWANDAHKLAQAAWIEQGGSIDEAYYQLKIAVVDKQLALASVRLGDAIEQSLGQQGSASHPKAGKKGHK